MGIKESKIDRVFYMVINILLVISLAVTLYPFVYVASNAISDPYAVAARQVWLLPKGFSLLSFQMVLDNPDIYQAYYNTLWYVIIGTTMGVFLTIATAYPLSRRGFFARNPIMILITFTMFFSGGLIPTFLLIKGLGLYNIRWAIVMPSATSAWNVIMARTYLQSNIPDSLCESAKIDGANDILILWKIVMPLSKPIIAVMVLFIAVARWNSYFDALVYLADPKLHPIQLLLRRILTITSEELVASAQGTSERSVIADQIRYTVIIVTMLPIICVYPFLQKYFVKGIMIGAIKG